MQKYLFTAICFVALVACKGDNLSMDEINDLISQKEYRKAIRYLKKNAELSPLDTIYEKLSFSYEQLEILDSALMNSKKCIELNPKNINCAVSVIIQDSNKSSSEKSDLIGKLVDGASDSTSKILLLKKQIDLLDSSKDSDKAHILITKMLGVSASDELIGNSCLTYIKFNDLKNANKMIGKIDIKDGINGNTELVTCRALVLIRTGKYKDARSLLDTNSINGTKYAENVSVELDRLKNELLANKNFEQVYKRLSVNELMANPEKYADNNVYVSGITCFADADYVQIHQSRMNMNGIRMDISNLSDEERSRVANRCSSIFCCGSHVVGNFTVEKSETYTSIRIIASDIEVK